MGGLSSLSNGLTNVSGMGGNDQNQDAIEVFGL
ncbi:MAG: hypothetical protein JWN67_4557, partial [Actinomycetia bacterium]|nr:hypothetical protein [Actinomycetes bacterium]